MKVLIDMNLTPAWVTYLSDAGHEVQHWSSVGDPDAADVVILEFARSSGHVVLTHDLDFGTLLALRGDDLPSVIQVRAQATLPADIGDQLIQCLRVTKEYLERGALVTVTPTSHRVSVLPLRETD